MTDKYTEDGLPIIGPLPDEPKKAPDGAIAVCGECGMRIHEVMHYYCTHSNCPVFLKPNLDMSFIT